MMYKNTTIIILMIGIVSLAIVLQAWLPNPNSDIAEPNSSAVQMTEGEPITWKDVIRYAKKGSPKPDRRVEKTDAEWKEQLTEEQYRITRQKGTERAFTGAYCSTHEPGIYDCVGCGTPLFDASIKFESKSGWPSFTQPIKDNVIKYKMDNSFGMERVEVLCNVCDAHLGHVFPDGPEPSGLRYCINSAAIVHEKDQ